MSYYWIAKNNDANVLGDCFNWQNDPQKELFEIDWSLSVNAFPPITGCLKCNYNIKARSVISQNG